MKVHERRANVHDFLSVEDQRHMLLWDKRIEEIELKYSLYFLLLAIPSFTILTAFVTHFLQSDWSWLIITAAVAIYTLVFRIIVYFKIRELVRKLDVRIRD